MRSFSNRFSGWLSRNPIVGFALGVFLASALAWAADSKISALVDGLRAEWDDEVVTQDGGTTNNRHDVEDLESYATIGHPRRRFYYYNDFTLSASSSASSNDLNEAINGTNADTIIASMDNVSHPGIQNLTTGTTATGRASLHSNLLLLRFSGGPWVYESNFDLNVLSSSAQRYQLFVGFYDTNSAVGQVDAVAAVYDEGGVVTGCSASANWQRYTSNNSTRTCTASSSAVATGYQTIRIEVNAAGTSVEWFLNGTSFGTETTNIPTASGRDVGFGIFIIKSVGTTAASLDWDYVAVEADLTTAR